MTMPIRHDLTLYKGQTYNQNIRFKAADGQPIPLDGITAKAQVRPSLNSQKLTVEMNCTVYPSEGKVNLSLDPVVTAALEPDIYAWDLKMTDENDNVAYYVKGQFIVSGRVTV